MKRLTLNTTDIPDLLTYTRTPHRDNRGLFERLFCADELREIGFSLHQINHSITVQKGSIRGMHYQRPPFCETKIVTCLAGSVLDVAIDLRRGSETFLQWHAEVLSPENAISMVIPKGFAHGFQTLEEGCELIYLHDTPYTAEAEGNINPLDQRTGIEWALPVTGISDRDRNAPFLTDDFDGITP